MRSLRLLPGLPALGLLVPFVLAQPASLGPPQAVELPLVDAGHGFGVVLPHQLPELDAQGNPTGNLIQVRTLGDLQTHGAPGNGLLPSPTLPVQAVLPSGAAGNHYLRFTFGQELDLASVFDLSPASLPTNSLRGLVSVTALDPISGVEVVVPGRAFVGGVTPGRVPVAGELPLLSLVRRTPQGGLAATSVDEDGDGTADGLGFPGTQGGFAGDLELVDRRTLVFVADSDDDLTSHETFPAGVQLRARVLPGLRARSGEVLRDELLVSVTVGADLLAPEWALSSSNPAAPDMEPPSGSLDLDPRTHLELRFTEPVQLDQLGPLPGLAAGTGEVSLTQGGSLALPVLANALPASVFALDRWVLVPAAPLLGSGTSQSNCGDLGQLDLELAPARLQDLVGNQNLLGAAGFLGVGEGPGLVNAPVVPDSLVIGRSGPAALSVLDLNGFGASTGSPRFDFTGLSTEATDSNYPNNPNVRFQPALLPPLAPGTCTVDGGSAGVFTLTRDSNLDETLLRTPTLADVADLALGQPLDIVFNNGQFPFGCQSGGGDFCALDGLKAICSTFQQVALVPAPGAFCGVAAGAGNSLSWAPHPNPPPLVFPPLCVTPLVAGQEPTSVTQPSGAPNLLVPGDPFGSPTSNPPIPPSGLLTLTQNTWFQGPTHGAAQLNQCEPYMIRQQVGHFLYALDAVRGELLVLSSNRMTVVDRLTLPGARRLALSPGGDLLAVTQRGADQVSFVDVDPRSATFHQVVQVTAVGAGPLGIAWQNGNEDILVCNELEGSLSVLSAFSLQERKRVTGFLSGGPFEVVAAPRQLGFAFDRQVYYAWILQRDGSVAVFESGPDGTNGWGYDDVIGLAPFTFQEPKTLRLDPTNPGSALWVVHEGPFSLQTGQSAPPGEGAVTRLLIESALTGPLILDPAQAGTPQFRSMTLGLDRALGEPELSGLPVDLAFDDLSNLAGLPNVVTIFSAGAPAPLNGRGLVRQVQGLFLPTRRPLAMLAAVPNPAQPARGSLDVFQYMAAGLPRLDVNRYQPGVQGVPVRGPRVLLDAFRE